MKNPYLKQWLANFPGLVNKLTKEELIVLGTIDPRQYIDFNLTEDREVINIVREHMPQAWKWVRLYPELKNLPPEDYAILDHIVPGDFVFDVTVEDLKRIIRSRKEEAHRKVESEKAEKRKRYYEDHKDEIASEHKLRRRLSRISTILGILGLSIVSTGVVAYINGTNGKGLLITGLLIAIIPLVFCSIVLKSIDKKSVEPKPITPITDKIDFLSASLIICFYLGLVGLSITIGTIFTYGILGWYVAQSQLTVGLCVAGGSVLLFLLLALVSPTSKE